jgi:prephenate dehydratase
MADTQTCGFEATLEALQNEVNTVTRFILITANVSRQRCRTGGIIQNAEVQTVCTAVRTAALQYCD